MPAPLSQAVRLIQLAGAAFAVFGALVSCSRPDYQPTAILSLIHISEPTRRS